MPATTAPIAPDTNVLVRCVVADDPVQTPAAVALLQHAGGIFLARTVLLETEWVLRAAYGLTRTAIHRCLLGLCGLPGARVEQADQVAQALDDFAAGLDFADALHLAAAQAAGCTLHTFDASCAKAARKRDRPAVLVKPRA